MIVKVRQEHLKEKNETENSVFNLADVITGRKIFSELTREEKYYYLRKHYYPKDQNSLFKKQCIKGGETKNLTYQLPWIQNKQWHAYRKELQGCLWKVFDYLTKIRDRHLEINLLKLYFKMLVSQKK